MLRGDYLRGFNVLASGRTIDRAYAHVPALRSCNRRMPVRELPPHRRRIVLVLFRVRVRGNRAELPGEVPGIDVETLGPAGFALARFRPAGLRCLAGGGAALRGGHCFFAGHAAHAGEFFYVHFGYGTSIRCVLASITCKYSLDNAD
jgi:hypothetical protein